MQERAHSSLSRGKMVHADHDGNQIKLRISLIRIRMHEPVATIENGALFSGTRVIGIPDLEQSPTSGSVAHKEANEAGRGRKGG